MHADQPHVELRKFGDACLHQLICVESSVGNDIMARAREGRDRSVVAQHRLPEDLLDHASLPAMVRPVNEPIFLKMM